MTIRKPFVAAACAATLALPSLLLAQQDTTRMRDTTMTRGSGSGAMNNATTRATGTAGATRTRSQPPMTSEQRLRVQKRGEAAGTLDLRADSIARADSINAARMRDSIATVERMRADSIAAVERRRADSLAVIEAARRDSIARADSIAAAEEARRQYLARYRFGANGWYMGVAAGAAAPTNTFQNLGYNSGFDVNVPIGWHRENALLGARLDLGYSRFSGNRFIGTGSGGSQVTLTNANPQVLSATLNLTAQTPLRFVRNVSVYGVGGGGLYHFRSFGGNSALGGYLGNDVLAQNEVNNKTTRSKFGAQVGAGLDWTVGTSSVFVESRFVNVFADRDDSVALNDFFGDTRSSTLRWVPIVVGVKLR